MPSLAELTKSLSIAFENSDYATCEKLLPPTKIELIKNNLLIPDLSIQNDIYLNDLTITKKILEVGALANIYTFDFDVFDSYFNQLKPYYFSSDHKLSESDKKSKLISLYLLNLLAQNNTTKFHSELQFLDRHIKNLEDDSLLSYPIKLDRWLMEGSYQKAWDLLQSGSQNITEFDSFTDILKSAIRDEIAKNTELSYDFLPLSNIKALLFFNNEKETEKFALERNWSVTNSKVYFKNQPKEALDEEDETMHEDGQKTKIIERAMDYAISIENIV
ncbi:regulatory particle non-ATPase [Saccharomyces pastorianus]|uniref:Regulatory particle non-ATPase n=1 Tax=Saccharomyces pastorianus TaxID=27292 RepID=A0A6C1E7Z6_SACPS|nr:regulatory particle non-ATPase [Saccharomyces pastorianus]